MDRGAWRATVHEVAKSWTRLSDYHSLTLNIYKRKLKTKKSLSFWHPVVKQ